MENNITVWTKEVQNSEPQPWLDWIEVGAKKYEGRIFRGSWNKIKVGDILNLYGGTKTVKTRVTAIKRYKTFAEAYIALGSELVPIPNATVSEVAAFYAGLFKTDADVADIEEFGVVAVGVQVIA